MSSGADVSRVQIGGLGMVELPVPGGEVSCNGCSETVNLEFGVLDRLDDALAFSKREECDGECRH